MPLNLRPIEDDPDSRAAELTDLIAEKRKRVLEIARSKRFDQMPEAQHELHRLLMEQKTLGIKARAKKA